MPQLTAQDGFCLGYTPTLDVQAVIGGAPGLLFVGVGSASLSGLSGTFLVQPVPMVSFPIGVGGATGLPGAGAASLPLGTDLTPLLGITLSMQGAFADPAGPTGKTLSNGATLTIQ